MHHPLLPVRWIRTGLALTVVGLAIATSGAAQSITPAWSTSTLEVGQTITISRTITLGNERVVDIFFLADLSGSMNTNNAISRVKSAAGYVTANAPGGAWNFGVGHYNPDYTEDQVLNPSKMAAQAAINGWAASGGVGTANPLDALEEIAANTAWRTGSERIIVWFGDMSQVVGANTAQTIAVLQSAGVKVAAFNMNSGASGGINASGQAAAIVSGTGGTLHHESTSLITNTLVYSRVSGLVSPPSPVDLVFGSDLVGDGLSLAFACTSRIGCDNVLPGQSRTFDMTITANTPGEYAFTTYAQGLTALTYDRVTVTAPPTSVVPEPSTWIMLATGLMGVGIFARVRRRAEEAA